MKLDKSFTSGVAQYGSALSIVDAVVKLAHALNLTVVAEGVESEEQVNYKIFQVTGLSAANTCFAFCLLSFSKFEVFIRIINLSG